MMHHLFQPDRIKQFGAGTLRYDSLRHYVPPLPGIDQRALEKHANPGPKGDKPTEDTGQRSPHTQSHMDSSEALTQLTVGSGARAAPGIPSLDSFNEDYHRNFSSMLGQMAIPRLPTDALCFLNMNEMKTCALNSLLFLFQGCWCSSSCSSHCELLLPDSK